MGFLTNAHFFHLTKQCARGLIEESTEGLDDPFKAGSVLRAGTPAPGIKVLKDGIGALDSTLSSTRDDVLSEAHEGSILDAAGSNQVIEWRAATGDLPEDHAKRVDVALVGEACAILGETLRCNVSHTGRMFS